MNQWDNKRINMLYLLHWLFFHINSKGSFICTIPKTRQYIPQLLIHQWQNADSNNKCFIGSIMRDRSDDLPHMELLPPRSCTPHSSFVSKNSVTLSLSAQQRTFVFYGIRIFFFIHLSLLKRDITLNFVL